MKNTTRSTGLLGMALAAAMIAGCAMPPAKPAPAQPVTVPVPVPAPVPPVAIQTPKGKAVAPMEFAPVVKVIMKGDGEEDKLVGREVAFRVKAVDKKTGFMDVDVKKHLYAECLSGTGKYKPGKMVGKYAGNTAYDDPPALSVKFTDCRAG